jgi:hypothetical protein
VAFDFAQARGLARRTVHDTMRVAGSYVAPGGSSPVELYVRWHHKMGLSGDIDNAGYAQMMVGVEVLIFDKDELTEKGVTLQFGGEVSLAGGVVLSLGAKHPDDGPVKEVWSVSAK